MHRLQACNVRRIITRDRKNGERNFFFSRGKRDSTRESRERRACLQARPFTTGLLSPSSLDSDLVAASSSLIPFSSAARLPQPFTRICRCVAASQSICLLRLAAPFCRRGLGLTFSASFREKLLSQCWHGNGFTARWIRLCRFKS